MSDQKLIPPFDLEAAQAKVRAAEDLWNQQVPQQIAQAYTQDSRWRNRSHFLQGHSAIIHFLMQKWEQEKSYKLIKELWSFQDHRIAVRFAYEWHDVNGRWWRSYGNENWQFNAEGLMEERHASINDVSIESRDRLFLWQGHVRPSDHPGLTDLGL
ncbi:nuclear transport factor 2 family protein [Swingsia samuiensis]|uniref:Nuclear transport factor 2 family protein n=1 Tax=Swingsia samuiensis TaxID=1293412 RepID=A0A4Y6UHT0_9PROT|nr:nuclear transport factor 2 family protein [Swingsia samuiensis]QDH16370.1 nuclear transport factor 2 family protein [Swingsia samuiensis]